MAVENVTGQYGLLSSVGGLVLTRGQACRANVYDAEGNKLSNVLSVDLLTGEARQMVYRDGTVAVAPDGQLMVASIVAARVEFVLPLGKTQK